MGESTGSKILVGIVIAIFTVAFGYLISYLDQHRKDRIAFVSAQIEKLYGPLYALTQANDKAWDLFHDGYWKNRQDFF